MFIPKFIPNFVEFGRLIQKMNFGDTGQTDTGILTTSSLPCFLSDKKKKKWGKSSNGVRLSAMNRTGNFYWGKGPTV
jgi:hypothetical protein